MSITWGSVSSFDANLTGSATIAGAASLASAAINTTGTASTTCFITLTYASGSTLGAQIQILKTYDGGTTYQASADGPWAFNLPFVTNTTEHFAFTVPSVDISSFKVNVVNSDATHSITNAGLKTQTSTN
jgi:hypothetical protein